MDFLLSYLNDVGLLILRTTLFIIFIYHGGKKLFGDKITSELKFLGFIEFIGAITIVLGFLTRISALIIATIMIGAIFLKITKWKIPFASEKISGWEFDLTLLGIAIALAIFGAGNISIDAIYNFIMLLI